ncbi:MAG: hypothetical protein OEZ14_01410, partial [Acidimicrobiia bacterium]|nr:hypothetical protein [Acidimicrobiia bacterium]
MKKIRYLLTIFLVFAMIAASCGGSDDGAAVEDDTSTEDTTDTTEAMDDTTDSTEAMDEGGGGEVATDFGVDAENKVIRVGLNADLSGPFASLVSEIVAAQQVYWEAFNEAGGYEGWTVEPVV